MSEWLKITYDPEPFSADELHTIWIKGSLVNMIDVEGDCKLTVRLGSGEDWSEVVYKNVHEARLVNTDDDKGPCCKDEKKPDSLKERCGVPFWKVVPETGEGYPYNWRDVIYPDGQPFFFSGSNHDIKTNKVSHSSE